MFTRRAELVAAAILLCAARAFAHGVDHGTAAVMVTRDRVAIERAVDADPEASAPPEIIVRDADGRRLPGRVVAATPSADATHVTVEVKHALAAPPRWLSFQLGQGSATTSQAHRVDLTIIDATVRRGPEPRVVTLTSGGNVETLRFGAPPETSSACGPALLDQHPERLEGILALLRPDGDGRRLDVVMPLGILESWLPLSRARPDMVSVEEQAQARAAIGELVASRLRGGAARDVAFLGLDDPAVGSSPVARELGAFTARVRVTLRFAQAGPIEWELWNPRVLTADVVIMSGDSCEQRHLSTYAPRLSP